MSTARVVFSLVISMDFKTPRARAAAASPALNPSVMRIVESTSEAGTGTDSARLSVPLGDRAGGQEAGGDGHAAASQPSA